MNLPEEVKAWALRLVAAPESKEWHVRERAKLAKVTAWEQIRTLHSKLNPWHKFHTTNYWVWYRRRT